MKFHIETLSAPILLKICKEDVQEDLAAFTDFRRDLLSHFREPSTIIKLF